MKRNSYAAIAALFVLAFASTIQAQPHPGGYYHIKLLDSVSVNTGDWNAVCDVNNYIWVVGDSGKVRRYHVWLDSMDRYFLDDTMDFSLGDDNYTLCDVCFPSQQYGYIVGYEKREVGGEVPGVTVPGKGYIWYTHNGGSGSTNWHMVDTLDMPEAFRKKPIPCLSVDFYNNQYGYVGCGCGYVLYSNDFGVSWRALRDTTLQKRPPWDSVGFHIGSIPRDMAKELHYYNHFGDWYWDIKTPNASNVYVASDNNGVFFESTDACENWSYHCFGQDTAAPQAGYGAENVPEVTDDQFAEETDTVDTALSILSIHVDNSGKLSLGSSTLGKLFYQAGSDWYVQYPVLHGQSLDETLVAPYGIWINGCDKMVLTLPEIGPLTIRRSAGSYGFMSHDSRVDWFSHRYVFNDLTGYSSWRQDTLPGDTNTLLFGWTLAAGTHGALLWHAGCFTFPQPPDSFGFPLQQDIKLEIIDNDYDQGGSVQLHATKTSAEITQYEWMISTKPDTANWSVPDLDSPRVKTIWRVYGPTTEPYYPSDSSWLEKQTLPGYAQAFGVRGLKSDTTLVAEDGKGDNTAGDDDLKPEPLSKPDYEYIYDWPGLSEDSMVTELWWEEPEFSEDSSLAGYFVCPVEVTAHYDYETDTLTYRYWIPGTAYKPGVIPLDVSYRYIPFEDLPELYDSLKCQYVWPDSDPPSGHHIVHTAPIRRNLWHGVGPRPDSSGPEQGQFYSVIAVDYSGNVDTENGWSEWLYAPYPGPAGISESEGFACIPFDLQVITPTITSRLTSIKYSLPRDAEVHLNIYDVTGRRVKSIFNGNLKAGYHTADIHFWDDRGLPFAQGVYFIRYSSEDRKVSRKIVLLR